MLEQKTRSNHNKETYSYRPLANDEIDLHEVWGVLKNQRWLIVWFTMTVTMITTVVVMLLLNMYRVEVVVIPPITKDIEKLNIQIPSSDGFLVEDFNKITTEEAFDSFSKNIVSYQLRNDYYKEIIIQDGKDNIGNKIDFKIFQKKFNNQIKIKQMSSKKGGILKSVSIRLEGENEERLVEWVNNYVTFVERYTSRNIVDGVNEKIKSRILMLTNQVDSLYDIASNSRSNQIIRLKEALVISEKIGLSYIKFNSSTSNQPASADNPVIYNLSEAPLYYRGSKALRAEIETLQKRQDESPFIPVLPYYQNRISLFESIDIENSIIRSARVDRGALVSNKAIKPKRLLIVFGTSLIGVIVAVFWAFIRKSK